MNLCGTIEKKKEFTSAYLQLWVPETQKIRLEQIGQRDMTFRQLYPPKGQV